MSDKPAFLKKKLPVLTPGRRAKIKRHSKLMAEVVHGVDRMVGKTVARLKASGELDNTLIIFASDNGFALGEHNIPSGKDLPYEEVTNVPLIMRGPGVPVGQHNDTLVTLQDITSTITDLSGAKAGRTQDGVSLYDVIADPAAYADRAVLIESGGIMGSTRELGRTSPEQELLPGSADPGALLHPVRHRRHRALRPQHRPARAGLAEGPRAEGIDEERARQAPEVQGLGLQPADHRRLSRAPAGELVVHVRVKNDERAPAGVRRSHR